MTERAVDNPEVVARPLRSIVIATPFAVAVAVAFTVAGVLLRRSDTGVVFAVSDQVAMIGIGIVIAAAIMLFAVPRVRADARGVEVRNLVTRRYFAWSEVLAVSFPDGSSFARLELPDDEYYTMMAVQAVDGHRAVEAVRGLRRLHNQARQ